MKNCEINAAKWPKGNTLHVVFYPIINDERDNLELAANLNVSLELACENRRRPIAVTNPRIEDGSVKFTVRGEDQRYEGLHKLIVRYTIAGDLRTLGCYPFCITPIGSSGNAESCCADIELPELVLSAEINIDSGGGNCAQIIEVANEQEAIELSKDDTKNLYVWAL